MTAMFVVYLVNGLHQMQLPRAVNAQKGALLQLTVRHNVGQKYACPAVDEAGFVNAVE
jgi:hypothetical protein